MKTVGKIIIGVILLIIGFILATNSGRRMAGGESVVTETPVRIEYRVEGN